MARIKRSKAKPVKGLNSHAQRVFSPKENGFHFINYFTDVPYEFEILEQKIHVGSATNGMCGGMAFAARDLFEAGQLPPTDTQSPSSGAWFIFLCERLQDSFNLLEIPPGPVKYMLFMDPYLPDGETWLSERGLAPHGRSWRMVKEEWPMIQKDLDNGHPCPLGLITVKSINPQDLGKNHQVLAYAYDLSADDLIIHLYDPNNPNQDTTLTLNIGHPELPTHVHYSLIDYRTGEPEKIYYFFRVDYTFKQPPSA